MKKKRIAPKKATTRRPKSVPDRSTVVDELTFVSPKGRVYRVRRTTQKDEYEENQDSPPKADDES